jgi:glutamate racemase
VIETGANAAQASSKTGDVLVIATDATVQSHAYEAACSERGLRTFEKACPLLVPLVEEGWIEHPVTLEVLRIYLADLLEQSRAAQMMPDTLVLGCTHYPLLRTQIARAVPHLKVIDSADVTAEQVSAAIGSAAQGESGLRRFFATDSVSKFQRLGTRFLGDAIECVGLVDLGG